MWNMPISQHETHTTVITFNATDEWGFTCSCEAHKGGENFADGYKLPQDAAADATEHVAQFKCPNCGEWIAEAEETCSDYECELTVMTDEDIREMAAEARGR